MDQRTAFRLMVSHIESTWETAARLTGKSVDTLYHAWSGKDTRYVPSAIDGEIVSRYAIANGTPHCHEWIEAVEALKGSSAGVGAEKLQAHAASFLKETSDVITAITLAMADGKLSANERKAIRKELLEAAEAMRVVDADVDADEAANVHPLRA